MERKRTFINGITIQNGSCLPVLLLEEGYEVHCFKRRASSFSTHQVEPIYRDAHVAKNKLAGRSRISVQGNVR